MEKGMLYSAEPLNRGFRDPWLRRRQVYPPAILKNGGVPIRGRDDEWMDEFFSKLFRGVIKIEYPWRFYQKDYDFRTNRLCVTMVNTKAWMGWFEDKFENVKIIYYLRHPLPQSLSIIKNRWAVTTPYYLNDEWFVDNFMTGSLVDYVKGTLNHGNALINYVTNWCV